MEPNKSSIYEENKVYFQILEKQKDKRNDRFIRKVLRISAEIRKELAKGETSSANLSEEIRYYQRKFDMDGQFQGNVTSDFQLSQIQGKWPRNLDFLDRESKKVNLSVKYELEKN